MNKWVFIVCLLLFSACRESSEVDIDTGFDYYPLSIGMEWRYEVDSTFFDEFNENQFTITSTVLEEVVDTFTSLDGTLKHIIERTTLNDDGSIRNKSSYHVNKSDKRVLRTLDNESLVVLTFPVSQGSTWDGYAFTPRPATSFEYVSIEQNAVIGSFSFDSVATVLHYEDTTNFIFKQMELERYAKDFGRVYREYLLKETQLGVDSGIWVVERLQVQ